MDKTCKHILLVAMACSPGETSETGLAWKCILALWRHVRFTIITHGSHRSNIEAFLEHQPEFAQNVKFHFIGEPIQHHRNQFLARLLIWKHYRDWMKQVTEFVRTTNPLDRHTICHHVTFSTWRLGSPFWRAGLPTVWGPIGGGGRVPWRCLRFMSLTGILVELLRDSISFCYRFTSAFRSSLKQNSVVLASNRETADFLESFTTRPVEVIFPTWFSSDDIPQKVMHSNTSALRCFTGGGVIASKGIGYCLVAIASALKDGYHIELEIAGYGPEKPYLQKLIRRLGIGQQVSFLPLLSGDEYRNKLREADVFLFPSFRENIGMTMVEAMLNEQAPIVLDRSAPSEIVTKQCGWIISSSTPDTVLNGLVSALKEASSDRLLLREKQYAARQRIISEYSEDKYRQRILKVYDVAWSRDKSSFGKGSQTDYL